ncbi:MAG: DNA-binding transcriptional MerR regulator/methylmalonyl-CoA mutase cobalamin-binding subunit [Verrucomicrobiales bacterium]|jgi:DNA-binding transcriptional MerR regulator/methylmalonyl-CoA mutase cobalamin-binding subunit
MKIVAQRTGLSPHVVRAWEKRYRAVEPNRSGTNRRLYSEADIDRLTLLYGLTQVGHSIGQIADLKTAQLQQLSNQTASRESGLLHVLNAGKPTEVDGTPDIEQHLEAALDACRRMDQGDLEAVLDSAVVQLGYSGLVERLAGPLITTIGEAWHDGTMTAAQEHAATATIRSHIERHVRIYSASDGAPTIVITTPAGQVHELGAVLATAVAKKVGWNVVFLGPSLPAAEIVSAVRQSGATALALSISFPADDNALPSELHLLRKLAGDGLTIIAGGRCAPAYANALEESNIAHIPDLSSLREKLLLLRGHTKASSVG